MKAYLVGGAVRDELLGRPINDLDYVVTGATIQQMLNFGFTQVGADFPVFLHPLSKDEYALARTERKTEIGHKGFEVDFTPYVTLEQDLMRRDLTINAIAKNSEGDLIDPFDGRKDLDQRLLRHISPAFAEDPLRVLRVARFAAQLADWQFVVAETTLQLMKQLVDSGELASLTAERVFNESDKALHCAHPQVYIELLQQVGALEVLMPQLQQVDTECLNWVKKLTASPQVAYAVLAYYAGDQVSDFNRLLKVPLSYTKCAERVRNYYEMMKCLPQASALQVVNLLARLDVYRQPDNLLMFIHACQALAKQDDFVSGQLLQQSYQRCLQVTATPFIKQGFKGSEISAKMQQQRISVVNQLL